MSGNANKQEVRRVIFMVMSALNERLRMSTYQYFDSRVNKSQAECYKRVNDRIEELLKTDHDDVKSLIGVEAGDQIETGKLYSVKADKLGLDKSDLGIEDTNDAELIISVRFKMIKNELSVAEISYSYGSKENIIRNIAPEGVVGYDCANLTFKGISQLEAGTKYYLNLLAGQNHKVDAIVVLASPETLKKKGDETNQYSACDLYASRIKSYIKGEPQENYGVGDTAKEKKETPFKKGDLYEGTDLDRMFIFISEKSTTDEGSRSNSNMQRLWDAAEAIKGDSDMVELYIDMQGGFRHDIPAINTILSLLSGQQVNIDVKERVATEFYPGNIVQPIYSVAKDYDYYDLVTAYQIFKRYGRGDELSKYFVGGDDIDARISKAIMTISDAIKMCDVEGFDAGIEELNSAIQNRKERDSSSGSLTEMDFIIEDIEKDYEGLLIGDKESHKQRPLKYVKEIRWCVKKDFIQQALTILEAKMPTEYVWNGLKYYCETPEGLLYISGEAKQLYDDRMREQNSSPYSQRFQLLDFNHYFIKQNYKPATLKYARDTNDDNLKDQVERSIKKYKEELCTLRNSMNHARTESAFIDGLRSYYPDDPMLIDEQKDVKKAIIEYLDQFESLVKRVKPEIVTGVRDINLDFVTPRDSYELIIECASRTGNSLMGIIQHEELGKINAVMQRGDMGRPNATRDEMERYVGRRKRVQIKEFEPANGRVRVCLVSD